MKKWPRFTSVHEKSGVYLFSVDCSGLLHNLKIVGRRQSPDDGAPKCSRVPEIPTKWEFGRFFKAKVNKFIFLFFKESMTTPIAWELRTLVLDPTCDLLLRMIFSLSITTPSLQLDIKRGKSVTFCLDPISLLLFLKRGKHPEMSKCARFLK